MPIFRKPKTPSKMNYHVFLSFRGEDTRKNFTDHLYAELKRKGIRAFRDEEEIRRGEAISEELKRAIEESSFAIVVFSRNYASSSWCLDELQKIVESKKDTRQSVFPVFYDVDPSHLRRQTGNIGAAFEKHEERFAENIEKVEEWREVLAHVAGLSGWDIRNKHEAPIIEEITAKVWAKLFIKLPTDSENLVGIESKVHEMISLLKVELHNKCFIGIWGMGGIGKTTLARVVFEAVRNDFEFNCFLANVRENSETTGLVPLQRKLLSSFLQEKNMEINDSYEGVKAIGQLLHSKKVLLVLDDVSHRSQLESLAGNKDWFGAGSRIMVTTRDIHLLTEYEQFETYKVEILHRHESLKLLCRKAFKKDEPENGFLELSEKVVKYSGGLPLALEVLGSFLRKRSQHEWRNMLDKLEHEKQNLPQDIFNALRISYDGLEDEEYKNIFLDIACFSNWMEKVDVTRLLENCGFHSIFGINVLIEKSLLSSSSRNGKGFSYMHDLLQDMGSKMVLQESHDASGRSRLWSKEEIDLLLKGNKGTEKIQCIVLDIEQSHKATWHPDCLSNMHKLRLLDLSNVHLSCSLNYLPSALKVLIWDSYALKALPCIDQLFQLGGLQLCNSKIRKLWNGAPSLQELKVINLSGSKDLTETPDFTGTPKLKSMFLDGCISLVKVHESLGQLKNLVNLSLKGCKNLVTLPSKLETSNLKTFMLSGCSRLEKLPEFGECMESLSIIDATETNIREVPWSIIHLTNLKYFDLDDCCRLCSAKPMLPANLLTFADRCLYMEPSLVLHHLFASLVSQHPDFLQGPTHLLYKDFFLDFQGNLIPTWFEQREYKRDVYNHPLFKKKKIHSGSIFITADISHDVVDYKREWLGIAVCLVLEKKFDPATWRGFYINWRFKDCCHPIRSKREIVIKNHFVPLYLGFFPFDKKCCPQHPTGVGCQVGLTISFPKMVRGERISVGTKIPPYKNLRVLECGWRLISRNNLDA